MVAKIALHVVGGAKKIEDQILKEIIKTLARAFLDASAPIHRRVRESLSKRLGQSPLVADMRANGELAGQLGLPDAANRIERILEIWIRGVTVKAQPLKKVGKQIRGGLTIRGIDRDFKDVLGASEATFVTEAAEILPWLSWLLTQGTRPIIKDYRLAVNPIFSRTNRYVMVRAEDKFWSVPQEFAGTLNNNFLTQALAGFDKDIEKIISEELNKRIK